MKSLGIVRKIDNLGRIVVPKEWRDTRNWREKEALEIYSEEDSLILKKRTPGYMNIGIVRKMDELGRIVLPKEWRNIKNWQEGDSLEMYSDADSLVLKKYTPGCIGCGETNENNLIKEDGIVICKECIRKLSVKINHKS